MIKGLFPCHNFVTHFQLNNTDAAEMAATMITSLTGLCDSGELALLQMVEELPESK